MTEAAIGSNLRRIRSARRLSQKQISETAGISLGAYRNLEAHKSTPRLDTLQALAGALEVPIQDLLSPVLELKAARFRSFKRLRSRAQILANVSRWLGDFVELENLLGERGEFRLGKFGPADGGKEQPAAAAAWARQQLGLDEDEPVYDICGLLEAKGIKVRSLGVASDAFFGLSVAPSDGGPAIVVNTWERISVERWIFTAAHELGHLILHLGDYEVDARDESEVEEKEANIFAANFLMPSQAFAKEWKDTYGMPFIDRVLKVKRIFRVSYRTVLFRLAEGRPDTAEIWKAFQIQHKRRYGRTLLKRDEPEAMAMDAFRASFPEQSPAREPERLSRADFLEDRLSRLVRMAIDRSAITLARGAEILGLSLQEMRELSASWVG